METTTPIFDRIKSFVNNWKRCMIVSLIVIVVLITCLVTFLIFYKDNSNFLRNKYHSVDLPIKEEREIAYHPSRYDVLNKLNKLPYIPSDTWMSRLSDIKKNESITKLYFTGTKNSAWMFVLNNYGNYGRYTVRMQIMMGIRYFDYTINESDVLKHDASHDLEYVLRQYHDAITKYNHTSEYLILNVKGCVNKHNNKSIEIIYDILDDVLVKRIVNGTVRTVNDITMNTMTPGRNLLLFYSAACGVDVDLGDSVWPGNELWAGNTTNQTSISSFNTHDVFVKYHEPYTIGNYLTYQRRMFYTDPLRFDVVCSSNYTIETDGCIGVYSMLDRNNINYAYRKNF